MKLTKNHFTAIFSLLFVSLAAGTASAATDITAKIGESFNGGDAWNAYKSPAFLYGGEVTLGVSNIVQIGGFYERNALTNQINNSATRAFYGVVGRFGFSPLSTVFLDGQIGRVENSFGGSGTKMGYGVGFGYAFAMAPFVSLKPRMGYRYLPLDNGGGTANFSTADLQLLLSFSL